MNTRHAPERDTSPDVADHPPRILIVDDELQNRQLLEIMLSAGGFVDLVMASGGEEALGIVAKEPPDLILLDIMMPGMDGYAVATRIKSDPATRNIPIILVTALDDRDSRMRGLNVGAEDFLTKPVDRAELAVRVRNLLRLKAYGDYYDRYSQRLEAMVGTRTAELVERTNSLERQTAVLSQQAALLDLAQDAIVVHDMNGKVLFWSRGAESLYGWRTEEAIGRDSEVLLRPEFSEPVAQVEAKLVGRGTWDGEVVHHKRDGSRLIVASRWALQREADGAPARVLTINNDITDRHQADADLLLLTERLWLAAAVAQVGVWEWDLATNTQIWDNTMFGIYGFPAIVPIPYAQWSGAVCPEDLPVVEAAFRRVIAEKGHGSVEFRIIRADGCVRTISAVQRVVLDQRSHVGRLIGVNMDITERREAEEALEDSRKDQMRFKDEFLSRVSHELRSPLTAIKQFTTILLGGLAGDLNKEQREYQLIVLKNIRQLQSMIDDLLAVTRLEGGRLSVESESVTVRDAVSDAVHTLQVTARNTGLTLLNDVAPDLAAAHADPTRLRQILIILLDNAIKFTPAGGVVRVAAREHSDEPGFLRIEVSDTGRGMRPEMTERVFERLYQGSETDTGRLGLGLGLYICKELVTQQGGRIWVESELQKGSSFFFTVPVFSLRVLIAPLLQNNGRWPAESVAIFRVETSLNRAGASREAENEWAREVRDVVERCLLPDLDVLLPAVHSCVEPTCFFIAAFADDTRASGLANNLRGQCGRLLELKQGGATVAVSDHLLHPLPADVGGAIERIVTSWASDRAPAPASLVSEEALRD